jgi:two-component system response regulator PilR (NtrC family)
MAKITSSTVTRPIIGESKPVIEMLKWIERVAPTKTNVLIIGESGTGKELVARMIHELGPLKDAPFVPVNCGAISEHLIESEMFGHKKGSFTGAIADKEGLFQAANGGTLFLDEVGELPLSMQVKLLRAIQDRTIRKVGGHESIKVDVRLIAATNRDLEEAVKKGTFREDLYYRLNVILIRTPPLRERKSDIEILARHFLKVYSERQGKSEMTFSKDAIDLLKSYAWPGNVRELENVIQRVVTLQSGSEITLEHFPPNMLLARAQPMHGGEGRELKIPNLFETSIHLDSWLKDAEKFWCEQALKWASGDVLKASERLGLSEAEWKARFGGKQ